MHTTVHKPDHKASHKPHAAPATNGHAMEKEKQRVKTDHAKKEKDAETARAAAEKSNDDAKAKAVALASSESNPPHSAHREEEIVAPPDKVLSDLQVFSNKFRAVAKDQKAVAALVEQGLVNVPAINPGNPATYSLTESEALCQRFKLATDEKEVRRICDEIDAP